MSTFTQNTVVTSHPSAFRPRRRPLRLVPPAPAEPDVELQVGVTLTDDDVVAIGRLAAAGLLAQPVAARQTPDATAGAGP